MADRSDLELLQLWREGDRVAGEELLARYFVPVYRYFARHVRGDVDDLTQRTFEGCITGRDRLRDDAAFRSYLFGIARRQLSTYFTKRHRGAEVSLAPEMPDFRTSPSREFARVDQQRLLLKEVMRLPDDVRPTVEMFYLEGRKMREISVQLRVPLGTIKSRLFRGRELLRAALSEGPRNDTVTETLQALEEASDELDRHGGDD